MRRYVDRLVSIVHVLKDLRKDALNVAPYSKSVFKEFTVRISNMSEVSKNTSVDSIFLFVWPHLKIRDWELRSLGDYQYSISAGGWEHSLRGGKVMVQWRERSMVSDLKASDLSL